MKFRVKLSLLLSLLAAGQASAQAAGHWVERSAEVQVEEKNANVAQKLLMEMATEKISLDMIREVIGEAKFNRNLPLVQNKVVKNSARFVPVSKPGELQAIENGFKMTVTLKISTDDLQTLLLENGLFYESDSTPVILPMVQIEDLDSGRNWHWWKDPASDASPLQAKMGRDLESHLRQQFWKHQFYLQKPQAYHSGEWTKGSETGNWANFVSAPLILKGEVTIGKNKTRKDVTTLRIHLQVSQNQNGREIGEVSRQFDTEPGLADATVPAKMREVLDSVCADLAGQVLEAWQKGALGSNLYRLVIQGQLKPQQQEALKEELRNRLHEIKTVRERLISANELVYEVDTSLTPADIIKKLPQFNVGTATFKALKASDREAFYQFAPGAEVHK